MNRPLKFRTWDERLKKYWHTLDGATRHGLILTSDGMPGIVTDVFDKFSPEKTINYFESTYLVTEQFTGLLDKNGREIYEGDVVRWLHPDVDVGACRYVTTQDFYAPSPDQCYFGLDVAIRGGMCHFQSDDEYEVIGNIHENPDLLKS